MSEHGAAFAIPFNFKCNMTMFWKNLILTMCVCVCLCVCVCVCVCVCEGGGTVKIFATMLLHVSFL